MLVWRRLRVDLLALYKHLRGGCREVGDGLFQHTYNERSRGKDLKLREGKFRLNIKTKVSLFG